MSGRNYRSTTLVAEADLRTRQNKLVKGGSAARGIALCGAGEAAIGVLLNKPNTGEAAEVAFEGIVPVTLGATAAAWAEVASDADGDAVAITATDARSLGILIEGGNSGDVVAMLLHANGRIIPTP